MVKDKNDIWFERYNAGRQQNTHSSDTWIFLIRYIWIDREIEINNEFEICGVSQGFTL